MEIGGFCLSVVSVVFLFVFLSLLFLFVVVAILGATG
jgi:hypothetical protein